MEKNIFGMFRNLTCLSTRDDEVKDEVTHHLSNLQTEFKSYFMELGRDDFSLLINPFLVSIEQVDDELQSELMDFK